MPTDSIRRLTLFCYVRNDDYMQVFEVEIDVKADDDGCISDKFAFVALTVTRNIAERG